ncbi:MAG: sulfite exporter TauE/SafE family protein [Pirellulaceae bacterium]|nr:sulfite exporter TauE/SafE family protein [Pirellulaceae bacterium]
MLVVTALAYAAFWAMTLTKNRQWAWPTPYQALVGFITDFLDTLGVGSFAVTTALYRPLKVVEDHLIPGTLNVGHALPTIVQALFFIAAIQVGSLTLWLLIAASVMGAWLGAGIVSRLPKAAVRQGMACALLAAAVLLILGMVGAMPIGGTALELTGVRLVVACVCNIIFGALMTIGVGAYAPIMVMVSLLGMDPKAAFPIMMGSCAFLMPAASWQFIKNERYSVRAALGLTALGVPGVIIAATLVKELDVSTLKWLVLAVVLYTALIMLASPAEISEPKESE